MDAPFVGGNQSNYEATSGNGDDSANYSDVDSKDYSDIDSKDYSDVDSKDYSDVESVNS